MDEMDLLARMRDNAPRRVSPRAEQLFRAGIYPTHYPERTGLPPHRRKRFLVAGSLAAAAAAAAIVVPAVLPGGAGFAKAWAVERRADGTVTLTINQEFSDLNGLQAALRADGVPAIVSVIPWKITHSHGGIGASLACDYGSLDREPASVVKAVITHPMVTLYVAYASRSYAVEVTKAKAKPGMRAVTAPDQSVSIIHPAAMPPGSVVFIEGSPSIPSEGIDGEVSYPLMVLRNDHLPACVPGHSGSSQWHSR
jgi:hypothetical protein